MFCILHFLHVLLSHIHVRNLFSYKLTHVLYLSHLRLHVTNCGAIFLQLEGCFFSCNLLNLYFIVFTYIVNFTIF